MKGLEGKVALVTGSGRGIGKETAKRLAEESCKVVICDIDVDVVDEAVEEVKEEGGEVLGLEMDVTDIDSVKEGIEKTVDEFGSLDILVNNAGITADALLAKMEEEKFDSVINVNLKGVFNCGREAAKVMLDQGEGVILNASSIVGLYGNIGQTNYAATKWGVIGMTKTWAKELGPKGIRVNAVAPGFTKTRMVESVPDKVIESLEGDTPLRRLAEPEEIADVYTFLASNEASFITGEVIDVSGGLVL